jgi:Mg2+ and Co2+ transporter CorA
MVVDGDEEEHVTHVYPITCAELLSGESREKHYREREKERVCIKLFSIVSFLFLEIKQCVLSPPSVSKPPPVVSPTNKMQVHRHDMRTYIPLHACYIFLFKLRVFSEKPARI